MTTSPIAEHEASLIAAFADVLKAEEEVSLAKSKLQEATGELTRAVNGAEHRLEQAWSVIANLMASTGEPEVILPGAVTNYKIGWSTPRETVKVELDVVPDEFCKIERRPKLKEIADYLKSLRETGGALPNWASFQLGSTKLQWKAVKKSTTPQEGKCQEV